MISIIKLVIACISFLSAIIFGTVGIWGLFKFSDPYSKLQASSLCGTTAVFSIFIGSLALAPNWAVAARIIIIAIFFLFSAPTGTHIVARFTWNSGFIPQKHVKKTKTRKVRKK